MFVDQRLRPPLGLRIMALEREPCPACNAAGNYPSADCALCGGYLFIMIEPVLASSPWIAEVEPNAYP